MRKYLQLLIALFAISFLPSIIANAQDSEGKIISLVVSGEGTTKEEATKNALRSAIEQAFGTFVSANTAVLNDELIKDEIVTVTSGNIQSYSEIYYSESENIKRMTLQAVVSIGNLVSFAQNKGMQTELTGATFMMNKKMRDLNEANEEKALQNLYSQLCQIVSKGIVDYSISLDEPRETPSMYSWFSDRSRQKAAMNYIDFSINVSPNENTDAFINCYKLNIEKIALTSNEVLEYEQLGRETFACHGGNYGLDYLMNLRFRSKKSAEMIRLINEMFSRVIEWGFIISDNTGFSISPIDFKEKYYRSLPCSLPESGVAYCIGGCIDYHKGNFSGKMREGTFAYPNSIMEQLNNIEIKPYPLSSWTISRIENINKAVLGSSGWTKSRRFNKFDCDELFDGDLWTSCVQNFTKETTDIALSMSAENFVNENNKLVVYNGYQKDETGYQEHGRVRGYKLFVVDENNDNLLIPVSEGKLQNSPEPQTIEIDKSNIPDLDRWKYRGKIQFIFRITSIYLGDKYETYAISEIH